MDSFNPTTKTQAAISSAVQAASMAGNPDVTPAHLLGALLAQADGTAAPLLAAVGADVASIRPELDVITQRLPSATGSTVAAPMLDRNQLQQVFIDVVSDKQLEGFCFKHAGTENRVEAIDVQ